MNNSLKMFFYRFNSAWLKHSIHYVFYIEWLKNWLTEIKPNDAW